MTKRGFFSMCLLMVGLVWPYGLLQAETTDHTALHFAMIPKKNIDQQIDEMCPLLRLLADKLERPVNVVRVSSYQAVIEGLLSADIDLAIMGPASYAYAKQRDGRIEAFASLTRKGWHFYSGGQLLSVGPGYSGREWRQDHFRAAWHKSRIYRPEKHLRFGDSPS